MIPKDFFNRQNEKQNASVSSNKLYHKQSKKSSALNDFSNQIPQNFCFIIVDKGKRERKEEKFPCRSRKTGAKRKMNAGDLKNSFEVRLISFLRNNYTLLSRFEKQITSEKA